MPEESHRILVVDDEASIRFAVCRYLTSRAYEVHCARAAEEAWALLQRHHYSAVITDLRLGGVDDLGGFDVVAYARSRDPETKVLVLTAYGSAERESEARERSVDAFLHKPQPLAKIAEMLADFLGRPA